MVEIASFKGITYNKEKVEINSVVSPPYDIISKDEQEALYKKSEYNVVRLVLGKKYPDDTENNNRYTRAAGFFHSWIENKILLKSSQSCIYVYEEDYTIRDKNKKMRGFIALLKLEDYGHNVKRHEKTLSSPKEDRLKLMRACPANLEPIFLLFSDPEKKIDFILDKNASKSPDYEVEYSNVFHRLWKIEDKDDINMIKNLMKTKGLFIADGHHRYETALNYRNEMRKKYPNVSGKELFNYMMIQFNNMDERLTILPTYRLIYNLPNLDINDVLNKANEFFDVEEIEFLPNEKKSEKIVSILKKRGEEGKKVFALYHDKRCYLLTLKDVEVMSRFSSDSMTLRKLDVSILHTLLIKKILGITDVEKNLKYTRDENEALSLVDEKKYQLSLFLNPPTLDELKSISKNNENMPQKSTYFYPKQITGLVMNALDGEIE